MRYNFDLANIVFGQSCEYDAKALSEYICSIAAAGLDLLEYRAHGPAGSNPEIIISGDADMVLAWAKANYDDSYDALSLELHQLQNA